MFSNHFDALMLKIIFYYLNTFLSEKYFEKQLQPHFQIFMINKKKHEKLEWHWTVEETRRCYSVKKLVNFYNKCVCIYIYINFSTIKYEINL